jgi:hypothetical protein
MSQFLQLTLGLLDSLGDLAWVAKVLVCVELNAELDGLASEQVGVNVPVLSGLERALVQGLDQAAVSNLCLGHECVWM